MTSANTHHCFLVTGSNVGDPSVNLTAAKGLISTRIGKITQQSSLYQTAAWGKTDQPDFLNQALGIETELSPTELISEILQVEKELGRIREEKYGPRIIDIDIIFYESLVLSLPGLTLPHPEMQNRRFVLEPLQEIAPDFLHPVLRKTIRQLLLESTDPLPVKKL